MNPRASAAECIDQVIHYHRSLSDVLASPHLQKLGNSDLSLLKDMCFGSLRWHFILSVWLEKLLVKPFKKKDSDLECLIRVGLYQLHWQNTPDHAVINETVNASKALKKSWAKGLINGVLRTFLREKADFTEMLEGEMGHSFPSWLKKRLKKSWPVQWENIITASNERAPMSIRVNLSNGTREEYLNRLSANEISGTAHDEVPSAIVLDNPVPVILLPGFSTGDSSVQDSAAQLAAGLLDCQSGMRVLDACAAPGGKTMHILERTKDLELFALDKDPKRLVRITENLDRLGTSANLIAADANQLADWYDDKPFDRILLDAPCSATGVIRRHPDIKLLRKPEDIETLVEQQRNLLATLWSILKPGGKLLYATCSILPQENEQQIQDFLASHDNAIAHLLAENTTGRQIFPGELQMDGFYYALLEKR